eukprot:GAHX01002615.1.p3 GENE.GAHX01002615.1~~GAHX01002615.1.p3  ORF type:complete len:115 (-),score=24.26 GAHX01002615.1:636-980(-)
MKVNVEESDEAMEYPIIKNELTHCGFDYFVLLVNASKLITRTHLGNDNMCHHCRATQQIGLPCVHQLTNDMAEAELLETINKRWFKTHLFGAYNLNWSNFDIIYNKEFLPFQAN